MLTMKNLKVLFFSIALFAVTAVSAQVTTTKTTVSLPDWGVAGADNAHYYYIPDIESYYDVAGNQFVYMSDGKWVKSPDLPAAYKDYDLYDGYKVVLTDPTEPYADFDKMKVKYAKGYKGDAQKTIKIKKRKDGTIKIKEKNN